MPNFSELERLKKNLKSILQRMPERDSRRHLHTPQKESAGPNNEKDKNKEF